MNNIIKTKIIPALMAITLFVIGTCGFAVAYKIFGSQHTKHSDANMSAAKDIPASRTARQSNIF